MGGNVNNKNTQLGELVGTRIASARKKAGLSQAELAALIGRSPNTVNRYERHQREVGVEDLIRLADSLGCDPCWLLTGDGTDECLGLGRGVEFGDGVAILPEPLGGEMVMRMEGDSMSPHIHHGDFVVIKKVETNSGDAVVVDDEWGGKHVRWQREVDGQVVFVAEGGDYRPMTGAFVKVAGKIVATVRVKRY